MTDSAVFAKGGVICCGGGTSIRKAGFGAIVSWLIKKFCPAHAGEYPLSHVMLVWPQEFWTDPRKPLCIESTIWNGVSGPQLNEIWPRLREDYEKSGGRAVFYPFRSDLALDWKAAWDYGKRLVHIRECGKLHYSVKRLFKDAVERVPGHDYILPLDLIETIGECDEGVVCSELVALEMWLLGLKEQLGKQWLPETKGAEIGCTPEQVRDLPVYGAAITIL